MASAKRVLIQSKDGAEYVTTEATFRNTYEEQGYKIVSYEDGSEYEAQETKAEKAKE